MLVTLTFAIRLLGVVYFPFATKRITQKRITQ